MRTVCLSQGIRSLSEFAREAIHRAMYGDDAGCGVMGKIRELAIRVDDLNRAVDRLAAAPPDSQLDVDQSPKSDGILARVSR